jgi:hypothetical protein
MVPKQSLGEKIAFPSWSLGTRVKELSAVSYQLSASIKIS